MLNKYWISIILLMHLLFYQNLFGQKNYEDFAQKYKGMGSLSEMIMSHKCIIRKNFNLFYETTIKKSEEDRTLIWYKFVFHQPCFISFTIIPNNETDRYELEVYKIKNNIKLCNTTVDSIFTKVDSVSKDVTYTDNFQSESFRGSLFNSKQINVDYNEAIYILVNNVSGPDLGHVIDLQTCDYSYVLKVNKDIIKIDAEDELDYLRKEFSAPLDRLKSIADKLCANSNDKKMGYSNFLGDAMATKNLNSTQVDSASKVQAKAIRKYDSLAGKPIPPIILNKKENLVDKKINQKSTNSKVDSVLTNFKQPKVKDSVEIKNYKKEITEKTITTIDSITTHKNETNVNEIKKLQSNSLKNKSIENKLTETNNAKIDSTLSKTYVTEITETTITTIDSLKNKSLKSKEVEEDATTDKLTNNTTESAKEEIDSTLNKTYFTEITETTITTIDSITRRKNINQVAEGKKTKSDSLKNKTIEKKLTETNKDKIDSTLSKTYVTETTETTITTIDSLKSTLITKIDSFAEISKTTELGKKNTVIKTSFSYGKNHPRIFLKSDSIQTSTDTSLVKTSSSKYNFIITDSIFEVISEIKASNEDPKNKPIKKTRPSKKSITVYFTVIDANTKKIIPNSGLKFGKKTKSKIDLLVYHDTISSYSAEFINSNKWLLKCDLFGYLPFEEYFNFANCINVDEQLYYLILVSPLKKGDKLALPNVFFHPNSIILKQKSYKELDKLVEYLNSNPAKIRINGHTQGNRFIDNTGKTVEEQFKFKGSSTKLSKKRAEIVYNYLIEKGIAKERLLVKGYAGRKPIVKHPKNKTERELNMRVEIKIIDINKKYSTNKTPEK